MDSSLIALAVNWALNINSVVVVVVVVAVVVVVVVVVVIIIIIMINTFLKHLIPL